MFRVLKNRQTKIVIALLSAFLATRVLSQTLFMNYSPRLNPDFLASTGRNLSRLASSLGATFKNATQQNTVSTSSTKKMTEAGTPFFGFNVHSLTNLDSAGVSETLNDLKQCNDNTASVVRFWGFLGGDRIQKVLDAAPTGMKFIIALSNFYSWGVAQPWPAPQGRETQWFANEWKTNGYKDFVDAVTKKYKGNDKILIWELMNEPNCTADVACSDAQHDFIRQVSDLIAANDPGKLISPGYQAQNTGGEHFDNGDYDKVTKFPNITANSCHMYGDEGAADFNSTAKSNCQKALDITKANNKFFYIGEAGLQYGCTTASCTNSCSADKLNQRKDALLAGKGFFDDAGSDGFVIWQFDLPGNEGLSCDGSSVFAGDPLCPATNGGTVPTNTPPPGGNPTATPTTPPGGGNPTATPTKPPGGGGGTAGKVKINVHVGTTDGPLFSGTTPTGNPYGDKTALIAYIEGPSSNGHRFSELLNVPGTAQGTCQSSSGFPYTCEAGSVTWNGADNAAGTSAGSYKAAVAHAPDGWKIVTAQASGSLAAGQTLTLDLAIEKE